MPTDTFSIAVSADDQFVYKETGYPPSSGVLRTSTNSSLVVRRGTDTIGSGDGVMRVTNALLKFTTSTLPDDAVISSALLRMYVSNRTSTNTLSVVGGYYQWDGSSASDHSHAPETNAISAVGIAGLTTSATNDFTLINLSNISKTGTTYLRLHVTQRASDATPTGDNAVHFASFDHATLVEPQLLVTYTTSGGATQDLLGAVGI